MPLMTRGATHPIIRVRGRRAGRLQHLAVDGIGALQYVEPFGRATCALARTAKVEYEQGDGERGEGESRLPPRSTVCRCCTGTARSARCPTV